MTFGLPPIYAEWLGDRTFQESHGVRFPYVMGSMANGIATPAIVIAAARAGMLGFFGAAGLAPARVADGLDRIVRVLGDRHGAWGANLIHSPMEPELEAKVADLFIERGVPCVEVSAFMGITPNVVRLACHGLRIDDAGYLVRRHRLFAKVSRPELARRFMSPAPAELLELLLAAGTITRDEAALAARVPLASDVTVEADSGGHTDNRPLSVLLPAVLAVRDDVIETSGITEPIRVGAAGGLGTPAAVAGAFALGAAYVLTGSVNQGAIESGVSDDAKRMLAEADLADVAMAAAADMFELGVKVQVLKRGSFFATRANKLYDLYRAHDSLETITGDVRLELEKKILGASVDEVWRETVRFWEQRDPSQIERARVDSKHHMALVFRWYLGRSSRWAIDGDASRRLDYQLWCGPAMGGFNAWTKGSFLERPENRSVVQIALNLLEGAAAVTRAHQLRTAGVAVPHNAYHYKPRPLHLRRDEQEEETAS
jgi:trans-AT polyketide synthase/acyltransferase/oxidoreductase domain-containing protein